MAKLDYSGLSRLLNDLKAKLVPQSRTINGMPLTSDITIDNSPGRLLVATCSTAASTQAKTASLDTGSMPALVDGLTVVLICTTDWNGGAYSLNIASTGARTLSRLNKGGLSYTRMRGFIPAGVVLQLTYSSSSDTWIVLNPPANEASTSTEYMYGIVQTPISLPSANTSTTGSIGTIDGQYATANHQHATPLATRSQAGVVRNASVATTLLASSWTDAGVSSSYYITYSWPGVTSNDVVDIGPDIPLNSAAPVRLADWRKFSPYLSLSSDANRVTIYLWDTEKPTVDLTVVLRVVG